MMHVQADDTDVQVDDVVVEETEVEGVEQVEDDQSEDQSTVTDEVESPDDDTVIVTIGEESPPSDEDEHRAPEWVRELRKTSREQARLLREKEQEIARLKGESAPEAVKVGEKPTLEGCDYDTEKFERELEAWHGRKRLADEEQRKKDEEAKAEQQAWQAKLDAYGKGKTELKVKDFEDAEANVQEHFSVIQQGVILNGADNAALLVYALGKSPAKAKELASIKDPVKFAFAVAKLETQLKVTQKKDVPPPERPVRGSAPVSGSVSPSRLEDLRAKAQKTGDYTEYLALKRSMKAA